jgi:glycosyltransferase involved in cell wall biosynthesis
MPKEPWKTTVGDCIYSISKNNGVKYEVILQTQEVEQYINKNRLLNDGFAKAKGDIIWHCDADFLIDETFLKRMSETLNGWAAWTEDEFYINEGHDVIWPMFWSPFAKGYKASDGGPFMRREILEQHGPLDESLIGISNVTFPFMKWCFDNVSHHASTDLTIELQDTGKYDMKKVDKETFYKVLPIKQEVIKLMKEHDYWSRQK